MSDITQILSQIEAGDACASEKLLPLVYEELKKLARLRMAGENPGQTLQATALVHEAYIRLVSRTHFGDSATLADTSSEPVDEPDLQDVWRDRSHFFGAAAKAMRRILVENARRKNAAKNGGNRHREPLSDVASPETMDSSELLALDDALKRLAQTYPRHAKLVELQFFAGLSQQEAAECLEISVATARRHWVFARAWLFQQLAEPAR